MNKSISLTVLLLISFAVVSYAQEICNNGIDDDNDGFIDCFDKKCVGNTACTGVYIGNDALCEAKPNKFPEFKMKLDWSSPNKTTNHLNRMSIGDLDRDGKPEVIVTNIEGTSKGIYILNGTDGSIKYQKKNLSFSIDREVVIGNLDNDACAEIFVTGTESGKRFIYAFNCDLTTQLWKSSQLAGDPGLFGLADFNGDGKVELYFRDVILNAHTGATIADSPIDFLDVTASPVAVDIKGDNKLELVNGLVIFDVNITGGTITENSRRNEYFIRNVPDGSHTSVADYNQDGKLDILASGSTIADETNTTIFFWDVANNTLKTFIDPQPGNVVINAVCNSNSSNYYEFGWYRGTGRINIADGDGDGNLNAAYVSGKYLYMLDESFNLKWKKTVSEETSGFTGCSMFDFNGDGKTEVVYRDEKSLYIIDGTDGSTFTSQTCISRTSRDYPIVADVDADGESEICVTCGFDNALAWANFCDITYSENSHVRIYKTDLEPWVPSRRLWNQNAYFNVNVNDDLTIPKQQQKQETIFSLTGCDPSNPRPTRPLNSFLNQSPFLNSKGCPKYAAPNLAYVPNSLVVNQPTCPDQNFTVSFTITNLGDVPLSGNVPITFYSGDPLAAGALKLNTVTAVLNSFKPNTQQVINATVTGTGGSFVLFVALNDSGTSIPTPIKFPNTDFLECDYDNVFKATVLPNPAPITALKIQDNIKCIGSLTPNNGAVRAFVPVGATENVADYNFFWFNGAVDPTPDFTGAIYSGLAEGTYSVFATHKTANCNSGTATVVVNKVDQVVTAKIKLLNAFDNCTNPNGKLQAEVFLNGSATPAPVGNFTYEWYTGNTPKTTPLLGVNAIISNLESLTYVVLVTDKTTGCEAFESFTVPNNSIKPVVSTNVIDAICSLSNSGTASATVSGLTNGYTFAWYNGSFTKPTSDFVGDTYTNLVTGSYTVVATNNGSGCASDPVTVPVTKTAAPTVSASASAPMTSCDAAFPNGSATASVGGSTAGYNFEWFAGQNTLPANKIGSSAGISGLSAGIYTVKATDATTGCSDTDEVTILFNVVTPSLILGSVNDLTNCTTPNGSVTVNVTLDAVTDYVFTWYKGSSVKAVTDFPGSTSNVLNGLPVGSYTVQATHKTKKCSTAPITAAVLDNTPSILINQVASLTQLPTDCNTANGAMGITVSAPGNTKGFKIEWFKNTTIPMPPVENNVTSSTRNSLTSALYRIVATNIDNGCSADKAFNLPFVNAQGLLLVSKSDATTCSPKNEGSIEVKLVPAPFNAGPPPFTFTVADYEVRFYNGKDDSSAPALTVAGGLGVPNGDGTSNYKRITLSPGFYTAVAVETNPLLSGCKSVPVTIEVLSTAVNPVITAASTSNNTNCAGVVLANGQINALADGATAGFTFNWFDGATTSSPALATTSGPNNSTANSLDAGPYTVEVINNVTQCKSNATFNIVNNPPTISVTSGDLTLTPLSRCDVSNGSAKLTAISPLTLADYNLEWFNNSLTSIGTTNPINNLSAGHYFLKATNPLNNCSSALIEFDIEDKTIGTVSVNLIGFTNATICQSPNDSKGELITEAKGSSANLSDYTTNWYVGNSASGPVVVSNPTLSGIDIFVTGLTSATRTVEVINNLNMCRAVQTYTLELIQVPVLLTASAESPMTSCKNPPNGVIFATVTNGVSSDFIYNWSIGNRSKPTPDFNTQRVDNLGIGNYTVNSFHKNYPFCKSEDITVSILDGRINPVVTAIETAPITICDPTRPDGVATASVNGQVANYTFDWFVGPTVSGTSFYTGAQASNLQAITYTVQATDNITGCAGSVSVTLTEKKLTIQNPDVTVISNVTQCTGLNNQPGNDGILSASISGDTKDYIFSWSNGNTIKPTADFTGEIYKDLAVGTYTVFATSKITGCVSGPAPGTIVPDLKIPDFEFDVTKATCDQDNGIVALRLTNNTDIGTIEWTVNGSTVNDPVLVNVPEGIYSVKVTTSKGCFTVKDVAVGTEIRPFNGISRNNDGKNEFFLINCIESFPKNYVKIFNRAGTLVYEAQGYNNIDIYFDGRSNRGVSILGNNLPDGTYFYIVDKNDGSKPLAGYLEIVN